MVRSVLYEAAPVMLTRVGPRVGRFSTLKRGALKRGALQVAQRRGRKCAKGALARKLATVLHRMWMEGTDFRVGKEAVAA